MTFTDAWLRPLFAWAIANPKIGETWQFIPDPSPFDYQEPRKVVINDTHNGWVQYGPMRKTGRFDSMRNWVFKASYKRVTQ